MATPPADAADAADADATAPEATAADATSADPPAAPVPTSAASVSPNPLPSTATAATVAATTSSISYQTKIYGSMSPHPLPLIVKVPATSTASSTVATLPESSATTAAASPAYRAYPAGCKPNPYVSSNIPPLTEFSKTTCVAASNATTTHETNAAAVSTAGPTHTIIYTNMPPFPLVVKVPVTSAASTAVSTLAESSGSGTHLADPKTIAAVATSRGFPTGSKRPFVSLNIPPFPAITGTTDTTVSSGTTATPNEINDTASTTAAYRTKIYANMPPFPLVLKVPITTAASPTSAPPESSTSNPFPRALTPAASPCPFVGPNLRPFHTTPKATATMAASTNNATPPETTTSNSPPAATTTAAATRPFINSSLPPFPPISMLTPNTAATSSETTSSSDPPPTAPISATVPSHPFISPNLLPPLLPLPPSYTSHSLVGSILGRPPNPAASSQAVIYPTNIPASRGSMQKPPSRGPDQMVTVATPVGYMRSNGGGSSGAVDYGAIHGQRGSGFSNSDHVVQLPQLQHQPPLISTRTQVLPHRQVPGGATNGPVTSSARASLVASNLKMSLSPSVPSVPEYNREKARDNSVLVVHDRKVRFQDCKIQDCPSKSLYALCRSWVHNSVPQEIQPFSGGGVKLLPRPLPLSVVESMSLEDTDPEADDVDKEEMHIEPLDNPNTHDLLTQHVRHAKRIRVKLKQDRFKRINRYKQRLLLLLPSQLVDDDKNNG